MLTLYATRPTAVRHIFWPQTGGRTAVCVNGPAATKQTDRQTDALADDALERAIAAEDETIDSPFNNLRFRRRLMKGGASFSVRSILVVSKMKEDFVHFWGGEGPPSEHGDGGGGGTGLKKARGDSVKRQ